MHDRVMVQDKKGFTLVEMLLVIVMIGLLATTLIPKIVSIVGRARDTQRKHDISQIAYGLTTYYQDNGKYPANGVNTGAGGRETSSDTGWMNGLILKYIPTPPKDPRNKYNGLFPWGSISITRDAELYVYNNYSSGPSWVDLYQCQLPPYALVGATMFEQLPPAMRASCPGYDRSTLMDYGYVLAKGNIYKEYKLSADVNGSGSTATGSTSTGTTYPPITINCLETASSLSVGDRVSCRCQAGVIEVHDDNVRGTSEYTHNSKMCNAAVHAGIITPSGGPITILITPGRNNYVGTLQNGVQSKNKNYSPRSFRLYTYP